MIDTCIGKKNAMPIQTVTDIESLPHSVRDPNSRHLIDDAIAAYYSGALRSSIVSTWIAVVNDIISKAREIDAPAGSDAEKFVKNVDNAIKLSQDKKHRSMPKIEIEILESARDIFQFINHHEHDILLRIREDRHKCAHPAFISKDQLFDPSPDLARSHIVHALQILLTRRPVQGLSDLNKFEDDVLSPAFPSTEQAITSYISSKYLAQRPESFVENLIEMTLETVFSDDENRFFGKIKQLAFTLGAIFNEKQELSSKKSQSFLMQKDHMPSGNNLLKLCAFLGVNPRIWTFLTEPIKINLTQLIKGCTVEDLIQYYVLDAISISDIEICFNEKMSNMEVDEKITLISNAPNRYFIPFAIEMFKNTRSYDRGNHIAINAILPLSAYFSANEIVLIHQIVKINNQIHESKYTESILERLFVLTKHLLPQTSHSWRDLVDNFNPKGYHNLRRLIVEEGY